MTNFVFPKKEDPDLSRQEEHSLEEKAATPIDKEEKAEPMWEFKKEVTKRASLVTLPPLIQKTDKLPLKPKIVDTVKEND